MSSPLAAILAQKKNEVTYLKKIGPPPPDTPPPLPIRNFKEALTAHGGTALIAEIKFASPSAGTIRRREDPRIIGQMYEAAGAQAISLVTERHYFSGSPEDLLPLKHAVSLPILRKDFIIDECQVEESLRLGADALLLIVRCLSGKRLRRLIDLCRRRGLEALVEVHSRPEIFKALDSGAGVIGINNRDLRRFQIRFETTLELLSAIPRGTTVVSESGIATAEQVSLLRNKGVQAVLVGTLLMRSPDPLGKARELVAAGRAHA